MNSFGVKQNFLDDQSRQKYFGELADLEKQGNNLAQRYSSLRADARRVLADAEARLTAARVKAAEVEKERWSALAPIQRRAQDIRAALRASPAPEIVELQNAYSDLWERVRGGHSHEAAIRYHKIRDRIQRLPLLPDPQRELRALSKEIESIGWQVAPKVTLAGAS